jgi:transcriptional regulator with PAS, ATPase and Fis domain
MIGCKAKDLLQKGYVDQSITLEVLKQQKKVTALQTCKTGKQVLVTGNPIYDETGKIMLVVMNVRDLTELNQLQSQLRDSEQIRNRLHKSLSERDGKAKIHNELVFRSPAMMQVLDRAARVAGGNTPVFLQGPSGVGKSMLAKLIHQISPRKEGPFIKINCAAIPGALLESELFGYEKGAFTGADPAGKAGLVETGKGGTVFLDEVTEISPNLQVKLLEIIEEKTFTPVGGIGSKSVDVRIIAASNRDLKQMIQRGDFREDLYFRLNVFPIAMPPLCRRSEDIPALTDHFITKLNRERKLKKRLSREVIDRLKEYPFPGNIRELINILEQMVIMSDGERISIEDIPAEVRSSDNRFTVFNKGDMSLKQAVETLEERIIKETVHGCRDLAQAAKKLGISSSTLWRKMTRYAIKTHHSNLQ